MMTMMKGLLVGTMVLGLGLVGGAKAAEAAVGITPLRVVAGSAARDGNRPKDGGRGAEFRRSSDLSSFGSWHFCPRRVSCGVVGGSPPASSPDNPSR